MKQKKLTSLKTTVCIAILIYWILLAVLYYANYPVTDPSKFILPKSILYFVQNNWPFFYEIPLCLFLAVKLPKQKRCPFPKRYFTSFALLFLSYLYRISLVISHTFKIANSKNILYTIFAQNIFDNIQLAFLITAFVMTSYILISEWRNMKHGQDA